MGSMKNPPHPGGSILEDCLKPLGMDVGQAARHLGVGRSYLSDVVAGLDRINADLAVRLSLAFGSSAETWMGIQANHDLAQVRARPIEVERLWPRDPLPDAPGGTLSGAATTVHVDAGQYDEETLLYPHGRPRNPRYWGLVSGGDGAYRLVLPDLPGCSAQGRTFRLTTSVAALAAAEWIKQEEAAGRPVPVPREIEEVSALPEVAESLRKRTSRLYPVVVERRTLP